MTRNMKGGPVVLHLCGRQPWEMRSEVYCTLD
jgi:hypothetical protein